MRIDSAADVGALVRQTRAKVGITQVELARQMGASREWVIRLEQGRSGLDFDRVMRALEELGMIMLVEPAPPDSVLAAYEEGQQE